MSRNLMACRILEEAEVDLRSVIQSLATAETEQLESAQFLLERMAGSLGEIEAAARRDASIPIESGLRGLREKLGQAASLSAIALSSVNRQALLAGLVPAGSGSKFSLQG